MDWGRVPLELSEILKSWITEASNQLMQPKLVTIGKTVLYGLIIKK